MGIISLCETLTQRRKLNLNSSSALNSRFPDGWTGLGRPGGPGEAAVGAPWSSCAWHRCLRRAPSPRPAHLQDTAAPPSSRFSVKDMLRARVLVSSVGYTGQWGPEPATPHPARPSRGTMSLAHMRWGGSGFLWHIKASHPERQEYVSQGPPRAVSDLLFPRTWHKWTAKTLYCNRVSDRRINSSSYKTKTSFGNKSIISKVYFLHNRKRLTDLGNELVVASGGRTGGRDS